MQVETGWPSAVISKLIRKVSAVANNRAVQEFYIGRTSDPQQCVGRHGCHVIDAIYYTDSIDNAIEVETALIQSFYYHPKCSNDAPDGRGSYSQDYGQFVYVARWFDLN